MAGARARTRSKKKLTLGFAGSGELDQKALVALLDDLVEGAEVDLVYLPVSNEDTTEEIEHAHRWCVNNDIPYAVVSVEEDVKADKGLKAIVAGATEDYEATEGGAGKDIVELLGDESIDDGRLLMFMKVEEEADLDVFAHTGEHDVAAFDLCNGLEPITFSDGDEEGTDPDPEPEPEKPARGRGRAAAKEEPEPDPEPSDGGDYTKAEQKAYDAMVARDSTLVELKKTLKQLDPKTYTTEALRGTDKAYCADAIILERRKEAEPEPADDGDGDEAQQATPPRRTRGGAKEAPQEPADDDPEADNREAVFARLRGNREAAERISQGLVSAMKVIVAEADESEVLERAAGALAAGLMVFAEHVITEVRKPKSAGRPRADGTEAQPKPPVDPNAPKRGRGRPRKDADD